tara:strand:- start:1170 stop:1400 length:231 start_codon:yes stop_codon:yes gene_type:complete
MGMFDYIDTPEVDCPECGSSLSNFQSKDGPCELKKINYREVYNFYTTCNGCGKWVEFVRKDAPDTGIHEHYRLADD